MKAYFAGVSDKKRFDVTQECGVKNYLFSYYELNKSRTVRSIFDNLIKLEADILIDSGAHTLQKGKQVVDYDKFLDSYIDFINQYKNHISAYVELDIENMVGLKRVEDWTEKLIDKIGIKPIVVWHRERGVQYWEDMCKKYRYVGFSGFVTTPDGGAELPDKYLPLFLKIAHENNTKIHGFGYTRWSKPHLLKHFYSVDSTSWLIGEKFGRYIGGNLQIDRSIGRRERDKANIFYVLKQEAYVNSLFSERGEKNEKQN